jgi:hypothetical protein
MTRKVRWKCSASSWTISARSCHLSVRVVVYRKHVSHRTRKNFQLALFHPDDGHYEYSAIATNKRVRRRTPELRRAAAPEIQCRITRALERLDEAA